MIYEISGTPTALNPLARIWNDSTDRNAVTAASHWLEQRIESRPIGYGEARGSSVVRIAYHPPFGIEFEIVADDKKVRVLRVWSVTRSE